MRSEWKEISLGEIAHIKTGKLNSNAAVDGGKYPFFTCSPEIYRIDTYAFDEEAILLAGNNAEGNFNIKHFCGKFNAYQRTYVITAKNIEQCNLKYLYYALKLCLLQFKALAQGTSTKFLTLKILNSFRIAFPPLQEQNRIADTLSALDDKIELNQKISANLERQARAVFKAWFVDFEPFDEENFYTSPIGLPIPKSLKMQQISDIEHILETGKRPKGGATSDGIPSIGAENVKRLGQFDFSSNKYIPFEFAVKQKTGKINGYELLLYKDGGKPGTFIPHFSMFGEGFPYSEFFINEHVFKLDFLDKGKNEFAYFYMQTNYVMNWLANNGGKAAIPGINQQNVRDIWIYDFQHPKVQEYCEWVQPLFTKIFRNCYENMALAKIRDTILPKLMSDKIEVS